MPARTEVERSAAVWRSYAPVLIALALLVAWNIAHKSIWTDEAYSLNTAGRSVVGTLRQARRFELQPPLYYLLLNGWLRLNRSVEFARVLSAMAILGGVAWLAAAARLLNHDRGLRIVCLAALTPALIWAGAEVRAYALVFCLTAGTQYFFVRLVTREDTVRRDALGYALLGYASLMTFYYAGFVLLGHAVAMLAQRHGRRPVSIGLAGIGLALLPWATTIASQRTSHPRLTASLLDPGVSWLSAADSLATQVPAALVAGAPLVMSRTGLLVTCALIAGILVLRLVAGARPWDAMDTTMLLAGLAPVAALLTIRAFDVAPVTPRHLMPAVAGLMLLADRMIGALRVRGIATGVVAAGLAAALVSFERNGVTQGDWASVGRYLTEHAASDEMVLIVNPEELFPFRYVYHGRARFEGLLDSAHTDVYVQMASLQPDSTAVIRRVTSLGWPSHVWIVEEWPAHDTSPARIAANTFLARHCVPVRQVFFDRLRVTYATLTPARSPQ